MKAVSLRSLSKCYGGALAVDGIDLDIGPSEFFVLLGPSGCGKTTTLRCIAGLEEPDGGTVTIGNRVVADPASARFVPPHRRDIGMVFQNYALWPHMTVFDNVRYPLQARRMSSVTAREAVTRALAVVGLSGTEQRRPSELSGGQQQRVALARAIVASPPLLLFDEPLSNLDAQLRLRLRQDLRRIHRETGHAAVYVTHDQAEALSLADRIAVMRRGAIEQLGTPSEIFSGPASAFVAEFVGFDNLVRGIVAESGAEEVLVQVPGWPGPVRACSRSALVAGALVEIAIRSSRLEIFATAADMIRQVNAFAARLEDASYGGTSYECTVTVGSTRLLGTMELDQFARQPCLPGPVTVRLRPADVVALPVVEGPQRRPGH